jgi:hypothetical protein
MSAAGGRSCGSWWPILWLRATGHTAAAVAEVTGSSRYWIGQLVTRDNTQAPPPCTIASI